MASFEWLLLRGSFRGFLFKIKALRMPRITFSPPRSHFILLTKQTKTKGMNASSPAQPPTTANNTINAKGNLPTGAQIPTLRPFAAHAVNAEVNVPAGNEDIIVGDYNIDGVVGIVCEESR